jgi:hypothetical protein
MHIKPGFRCVNDCVACESAPLERRSVLARMIEASQW